MPCQWLMQKFIHIFAQYNIQMPNTNAMLDANAMLVSVAVPFAELMPILAHG